MKAIISAAGKAPRLLPLTKHIPQCLLKINGKTILEIQVEKLRHGGIDDVIVITGYCSNMVEEYCKSLEVNTVFNPFYGVSGSALSLWLAKHCLNESFIYLYSDLIFDTSIICNLLRQKDYTCLAVKVGELRDEAEKIVEVAGVIKNITKSQIDGVNGEFIGIAKFSNTIIKELCQELDRIGKTDINLPFIALINNLITNGHKVNSYHVPGDSFIDIDFPEDLSIAQKKFVTDC
jgi:L-glutamine-phosphate cytidylyltransferase